MRKYSMRDAALAMDAMNLGYLQPGIRGKIDTARQKYLQAKRELEAFWDKGPITQADKNRRSKLLDQKDAAYKELERLGQQYTGNSKTFFDDGYAIAGRDSAAHDSRHSANIKQNISALEKIIPLFRTFDAYQGVAPREAQQVQRMIIQTLEKVLSDVRSMKP